MGNHLKRQAGVTEAVYRKGTIEVRSESAQGFQIAEIVKVVTTEIGLTPVKRIEATFRARVLPGGKTLEIAGTGERLAVDGTRLAEGAEQVWRGLIQSKSKGSLTFKPNAGG